MSKMKDTTRPASMGVLNSVRISYTKGTPSSTIKSVLKVSNEPELILNRYNLRKIEEKLSCAFVEFHRKLWFLKSYSFLNVLALSKILKKYDKVTSRDAAKSYMTMVDNSCLGSSDETMLIVLILPFNIFYRSSRYFFLNCLSRILAAPLCKVTLPDFFLADQLCSQAQTLRSIHFYICYYGWGDFKQRQNTCRESRVFNTFLFIAAAFPFVSRFLQCMRRVFEERNIEQGYNSFKYFLVVVAVCLGMAYEVDRKKDRQTIWRWSGGVTSAMAVVFCTYWDLVQDWGLLNRTSKNPWLRDELLVPHKEVYFIAMILNVVLRFAWLQTVLDLQFESINTQAVIAFVASLEIIRRGIWNFFRLENEHLNNVGKFRAFKTVSLPFNYEEDQ
ncbi:hypothetical protein F2Q70_00002467 [Brassica cretica]|uniref:EXS domain-containing protein n=1 Tax=Brassica cretica TaxID=69181 RepID=A0A8S9INK8_BRACR|nr:hypothetical protein F2Q70_00002467 [Brassica cretica]